MQDVCRVLVLCYLCSHVATGLSGGWTELCSPLGMLHMPGQTFILHAAARTAPAATVVCPDCVLCLGVCARRVVLRCIQLQALACRR